MLEMLTRKVTQMRVPAINQYCRNKHGDIYKVINRYTIGDDSFSVETFHLKLIFTRANKFKVTPNHVSLIREEFEMEYTFYRKKDIEMLRILYAE